MTRAYRDRRGPPTIGILALIALCGAASPVASFPALRPPKSSKPPAEASGPAIHTDARVGDWATYQSTASDKATRKRTITQVRADAVTIREEQDAKAPPWDYSLHKVGAPKPKTKDADPAKVEILDSGKETLTIGGKKYECEWTKTKITFSGQASLTAPAAPLVLIRKRWVSRDVPLDGEVRTEVEIGGRTVGWELTGLGRGK